MDEQKFNVNCGFFNSIDNDRLYSADEMNKPYKRVITNGVFATPNGTPSTDLQVFSNENSMNITVKKGEGLFGDKWFENPSDIVITVPSNNGVVPRIDSVIVQVDKSQNGRSGNVIYRTGTPNSNPVPPSINTETNKIEYRVANIRVNAGVQTITQSNITDLRGSSDCPWVTSLIQQVDTSTLYAQWQNAYEQYYENTTEEFDDYKETETTAFNAFMESLTEQLTVNTNMIKYESHYVSIADNTTEIPINIAPFDKNKDVLLVRVNRLFASETIDYTISNDSSKITLTKDIKANQNVDFIVLQSVVVGDTETVLQQVQTLSNRVTAIDNLIDIIQVTDDSGGVKISVASGNDVLEAFVDAGAGFHTMYSPSGAIGTPATAAFRYFGHMTSTTNGWIIAMQSNGSVYANYLSGSTWQGWRTIYEVNPTALWEGASFMGDNVTITPTKPLAQCRNGWVLVWSDYDDDSKVKNKYNEVTFCVPKKNAEGNNRTGSSFMCMLPVLVRADGTYEFTVKQVYIYPDKITGFASNSVGTNNRGVVLAAIYEY